MISRVARQLGVGDESLRTWVKQAEIDAGKRPGLTTEEQAELKRCARRTASCGGPTTSCRQQRLSSGRSSTADDKK